MNLAHRIARRIASAFGPSPAIVAATARLESATARLELAAARLEGAAELAEVFALALSEVAR